MIERRKSESKTRGQRLAAGAVGGVLAGPLAVLSLLHELGYTLQNWKLFALAIVANGVFTVASVCFWDIRWYLAEGIRKHFGIKGRE